MRRYNNLFLTASSIHVVRNSVAPIHDFADILIHRYLFSDTADTDADSDFA